VRVLLVGLGRWGEKHLRVLGELGVELWVAEPLESRRLEAVRAGVPVERVVADAGRALPYVDAVDIVTPADTHLALARAALAAGRDCFVEKPVTSTVAEGEMLREVARRSGRLLQVGHVFRFHPVTDVLREHLAGGGIGTVRYCAGRFAGFKRPRRDVGVTHSDAVHYYDLFAHLLGREATAATATVRDFLGRGLDDLSCATVEYGPVPALVEAGYFAPGLQRDCVIVGTEATLLADFGASVVYRFANRHLPAADGGWHAAAGAGETLKAGGGEPLRCELEAFIHAVATRTPPPVNLDAGIEAVRVAEAVQESARLGRRVEIAR
jgi:UDP-N-acetylglucosamine 3-dehydrogenase